MLFLVITIILILICIGIKIALAAINNSNSNIEYDLNNRQEFLKASIKCFGPVVETYKNATLFIGEQYSTTTGIMYDFSKWKDSNIIGVFKLDKEAEKDSKRFDIVFNQSICKFKDGTIL